MSDAANVVAPSIVAMLICDQVIDDKLTNKKSAIGLFNIIIVPRVPTTVPSMAVLISLTEMSGRTELELRLVRDGDNAIIFQSIGVIAAPDPLATVDLLFSLQGLKLEQAGQHAFEVLCAGEILARRRFHIRVMPAGGQIAPDTTQLPGTQG